MSQDFLMPMILKATLGATVLCAINVFEFLVYVTLSALCAHAQCLCRLSLLAFPALLLLLAHLLDLTGGVA